MAGAIERRQQVGHEQHRQHDQQQVTGDTQERTFPVGRAGRKWSGPVSRSEYVRSIMGSPFIWSSDGRKMFRATAVVGPAGRTKTTMFSYVIIIK